MTQELKLGEPSPIAITGSFFFFLRSFFGWWYGDIPLTIFSLLRRTIIVINDVTSFSLIVRGFFRPWKNDYNIAGWLVGIFIKTLYIPIISSLFIIAILLFVAILLVQLAILPVIFGLILINPFLRA